MRYLIRYMLSIVSASAAAMGGAACGEVPEMSRDRMQEISSHIFLGKVARIYSVLERSSAAVETTHGVAELQVKEVEKGKHEGRLAYLRFATKRAAGTNPTPGNSGHRDIPKVGDTVRVFVVTGEDGGYDVLPPNGFTAVNKQK